MLLSEVLQLDKVQSSIKKIDLFLVSQEKLSDDYMKAYAYKAIILHAIGKNNEALKLLFTMVPLFKEIDSNGIIAICDGIIDICLDLKRFDQVTKYIEVKKNYLPISKNMLYVKDNIKYYLASNQLSEAQNELLKYLDDDISKEEQIFAKEQLIKIYYETHQYSNYLDLAPDLISYYQSNLALSALAVLELNRISIYYELGNYIQAIISGGAYLHDDNIDINHKMACATIVINSYLKTNDFKRASIVESDYSENIDNCDSNIAIGFCKAALDLYTKKNSLISIKEYQEKIMSLQALKQEEKKINKRKKREEDIVIPVIPKEETFEEITPVKLFEEKIDDVKINNQEIKSDVKEIKNVIVSKSYQDLCDVFDTINSLDTNLKFREIFRQVGIKVCELYPIEEIYILFYKREYLGIQYKKERAYDKKLSYEDLDNTLSFAAMSFDSEMFIDPDNPTYSKSIITKKLYDEIPYGFAMPIYDDLSVVGSVAYFSNEPFIDKELSYEALKLITKMINARLLNYLKRDQIEFENKKLYFISENMSSGIKEEVDGFIHFSLAASKMLGVEENVLLNDFYSKIKTADLIEYKRLHEELYTLLSSNQEIEYEFKKDDKWINIKERFYPMVQNGVIYLLSLIDDITEIQNNKKALVDLAYKNPISKMNTEVKLMIDLENKLSFKKMSLAVVDIIDFSIYQDLYGYNFASQVIYTVGQNLTIAFENDFNVSLYHLNNDRYVVLFDQINDKRAVLNKLKKALEFTTKKLFELNFRVKLEFYGGVFLLQSHSNLNSSADMLNYAMDALEDSKALNPKNTLISFFSIENYKKRFNENHLVTHISESIDHGKVSLVYKQIVNLKEAKVLGYYISINLDNYEIEEEYMNYVIKRRSLSTMIDKYVISNTFKEMKMLHDTTRGYILAFISVDKATILESFNSFLETQRSFYKMSNEYICFIVADAAMQQVISIRKEGYKIASTSLIDVINEKCDYLLIDYHKIDLDKIDEIKNIANSHNVSCIFNNIDDKNDLDKANNYKFDYIYGKYYKKAIRMKNLVEKVS